MLVFKHSVGHGLSPILVDVYEKWPFIGISFTCGNLIIYLPQTYFQRYRNLSRYCDISYSPVSLCKSLASIKLSIFLFDLFWSFGTNCFNPRCDFRSSFIPSQSIEHMIIFLSCYNQNLLLLIYGYFFPKNSGKKVRMDGIIPVCKTRLENLSLLVT